MGKVKIETYNSQLMNVADYTNIQTLKTLYKSFTLLKKIEEKGDSVATAIRLDLEYAMEMIDPDYCDIIYNILICQDTYQEFASDYGISVWSVNKRLYNALRAASEILTDGSDEDD